MAEKIVWVSRAMMDSTLIKGFVSDDYFADKDLVVNAMKRNKIGEPLPAHRFPKEMYIERSGKTFKKMPEIFNAGGFWTVSAECAAVLTQFDMGRTSFYPTRLFQHNRTTPVEGEYFCLSFGETRDVFLPEHSPNARKPYPTEDIWLLQLNPHDDDIAVSSTALDGVDLWIDVRMPRAFFLSDPLVQALKAAKLTRRFGLRRCRVIDEN